MKNLSPMAARFERSHEGYVHPARSTPGSRPRSTWARSSMRPIWPGGSISGSDDGWDDCDE